MVETNFLNQTLNTNQLSGISYYISAVPKYLTEKTAEFLMSNNLPVNTRTVSLIYAFISLGLIFLGIKVLQKVNILIKIILIGLGILIFVGMWIPW